MHTMSLLIKISAFPFRSIHTIISSVSPFPLRLGPSSKAYFQQVDARPPAHATATIQVQKRRRAPRAPSSQTRTVSAHVPPSPHHAQRLSDSPTVGSPCWRCTVCAQHLFFDPADGRYPSAQCDLQKDDRTTLMSEREQRKEVGHGSRRRGTLPRQEGYDRTALYQNHDRYFSTEPTQKKPATVHSDISTRPILLLRTRGKV
jgi:hypothetical protein